MSIDVAQQPQPPRAAGKVSWLAIAGMLMIPVLAAGVLGVFDGEPERLRAECTQRGIAHFKEAGSYPTLSDGRDAAAVARERCMRTTGAFGR